MSENEILYIKQQAVYIRCYDALIGVLEQKDVPEGFEYDGLVQGADSEYYKAYSKGKEIVCVHFGKEGF